MAITRKPKSPAPPKVDVDALINKGGSTPEREAEVSGDVVPIVLRLPAPLAKQIDEHLKSRPIRKPRHTWILETLYERLNGPQSK